MREYSKVPVQIWINLLGRQIKQLGLDAQLTAFYLMTNSHTTMVGIYYLPISFISHETGLSFEQATKALQNLCEISFCSYDDLSEYIWIHDMAFDQIGLQLKPNDNRVKAVNEIYSGLPELHFLQAFYDKYHQAFCLAQRSEKLKFIEVPLDILLSQEQKQEQEQEQKQKKISMSGKQKIISQDNAFPDDPDSLLSKKSLSLKRQAIEVLKFLNEKTGRIYRPVDTNLKLIIALFKTGITVMNCRQVIAKKTREWKEDAKMAEYLRPATLFNATKFEQYFGELVVPKAEETNEPA